MLIVKFIFKSCIIKDITFVLKITNTKNKIPKTSVDICNTILNIFLNFIYMYTIPTHRYLLPKIKHF